MLKAFKKTVARVARNEEGASAVEYAILAAIIGVGIVTASGNVRDGITTAFGKIVTALA